MLKKPLKLNSLEIKSFLTNFNKFVNKTERQNYFDLRFFIQKGLENKNTKFAVIISNKVFKKAVFRNKVRREIYSIIENYLKENFFKNKIEAVLIYPKKDILNLKFLDLKNLLYNTLNKYLK